MKPQLKLLRNHQPHEGVVLISNNATSLLIKEISLHPDGRLLYGSPDDSCSFNRLKVMSMDLLAAGKT